ncbi:outer membrane protein [Ruegeria sediminis]|nr:outer membrane beta-barrel protein [Ruegeria sediminis]
MTYKAALAVAIASIAGMASAGDRNAFGGPPTASFDGVYLGASFGWGTADGTSEYPVLSGGTTTSSFDPGSGRVYSAFVGYNYQRGSIVYSAELRYMDLTGLNDSGMSAPEVREVTNTTDLRGRVGYVTGDWMFYGTLGWSWSSMRVHPGLQFGGRSNTADLDGVNYGLGAEYSINDRWSAGADLTLRDIDGQFSEASTPTDIDLNTLTFRVGYRF